MLADIPQRGRPQEGVGDGVEEDIGIAVAAQAGLAGYADAAKDEGPTLLKPMYIIAETYSHV